MYPYCNWVIDGPNNEREQAEEGRSECNHNHVVDVVWMLDLGTCWCSSRAAATNTALSTTKACSILAGTTSRLRQCNLSGHLWDNHRLHTTKAWMDRCWRRKPLFDEFLLSGNAYIEREKRLQQLTKLVLYVFVSQRRWEERRWKRTSCAEVKKKGSCRKGRGIGKLIVKLVEQRQNFTI